MASIITRAEISFDLVRRAMQTQAVREALAKKAREIQARAEQIAASEGVELESKVTELTRPKGRPEARVSSENVAQEFGNSFTERRRILGRAAGS